MTIVQSTMSRPKPGRAQEAIALGVEANKLLERSGAPRSRMMIAQLAGEQSGGYVFTTEYASGEQWGEVSEAFLADTELQALADRAEGEHGPVIMEGMNMGSVVPLDRKGSTERGAVIQAYISRPIPGQTAQMIELTCAAFDFIEANGGTNCRLMVLQNAGMMTDCTVGSWEFASMKDLGRLADAWLSPAGQKVSAQAASGHAGSTTVSSGIYVEIPL